MAPFDPASIHKAVAEFTPRRPQKFQDLAPAKDVIIELRLLVGFPLLLALSPGWGKSVMTSLSRLRPIHVAKGGRFYTV